MNVAVQMAGLACQSGHRFLLKDINWRVNCGERWVVFGQNGCGKTTLLSIAAGFKQPTEGSLEVFGRAYTADNILSIRRTIGWVSSSFFDRYYHQESALDIVLAGKSGTFSLDREITEADIIRAKALLKVFRVADKRNRAFDSLSKGERQSVLIARALFAKPRLLLLDEPSAGLDVYARAHLLATIRQLAENTQLTIVYVTHYVDELLPDIFKQALLLQNGHIFAQGAVETLFTEPVLSKFLSYPVRVSKNENGLDLKLKVPSAVGRFMREEAAP